ncbi:MAG: protein kinase domain-containing protein [Myxococcota bacterium]
MASRPNNHDSHSADGFDAFATIGPFTLVEFVGKGGMGDIWRARHQETRLEVAIKVIAERRARQAKYHALFDREAQSIASLDHPGIVKLYDYGRITEETSRRTGGEFVAGSPYLAMEFCEERSLAEAHEVTHWNRAKTILMSLLDGLAHAHARGVIHRDIKPGNVLVREATSSWSGIKLADFGLAYFLDLTEDETRSVTQGTPAYMPPEQLQGNWRDIGPWTDLYSTGCLAWELVTGQRPFEARSLMEMAQKHLSEPVPPLEPRFPVPAGLESWLLRLLIKQPLRRFRTAAEAAWGLVQLDAVDATASPESSPSDTSKAPRSLETLLQMPKTDDEVLIEGDTVPTEDSRTAMKPTRPPMTCNWQTRSERPGDRVMEPTLGLLGMRRIPLIDRHELRDQLWRVLADVIRKGTPQAVALRGTTGYGKRSLARWLAERAHETGIATVLPLSKNITGYAGVESHLATFFRTHELDIEDVWERIQNHFAQFLHPRPRLSEQLARLLTDDGEERVTPEYRAHTLGRAIAGLAAYRPVVLLCDNLTDSPEVLDFLKRAWRVPDFLDAPIFCVCTLQDDRLGGEDGLEDGVSTFLELSNAQQLDVGRLEHRDMRRLAAQLLRLSTDVADRVLSYSEGNPLFAIELVQHWADRGLLQWTPSGFTLTDTDANLIPAETLELSRQRLVAVLEDLTDDEVRTLALAAIMGSGIRDDVWDAICEHFEVNSASSVVERLTSSRLAERTAMGWRFAHTMSRHAMRALGTEWGITEALHRAAAQILEEVRPNEYERIGLHWYHAGECEKALQPLLEAISLLRLRSQVGRGQRLLKLVEDIVERLELPVHSRQRLELVDIRAWLGMLLNRFDEIQESLENAIELAVEHGEHDLHTVLRTRLMELFQMKGRFDEALELADAILSEDDIDFETVFLAKVSKGKMLVRIGKTQEALDLVKDLEAHPEFEQLNPGWRASIARIEGFALLRMERLEETVERMPEFAREQIEAGRPTGAAKMHLASANALMNLGRYDEAERVCREVLDNARALFPRDIQSAKMHLAYALFYRDDLNEAHELLLGLLVSFRRENRDFMLAYVLAGLAGIAAKRHSWSQFERRFGQLRDALDASGNIDADFARVMEIAADEASAAGRTDLAIRSLELAAAQLEELDLEDALLDVSQKLDELRAET